MADAAGVAMKCMVERFLHEECGATAIEYALIASLVSMSIITALMLVAPQIEATYSFVHENIESVL